VIRGLNQFHPQDLENFFLYRVIRQALFVTTIN